MTYKVVISKHHCKEANYLNSRGCPLYRAIKEQIPELDIDQVGGSSVSTNNGKFYAFDSNLETGWNWERMRDILASRIDSYTVELSYNLTY